jgi:hypothetical protein
VHKCQQKLSTAKNKRNIVFVDEVETQLREKPLQGSQTQEFHYSEDKARYKTVTQHERIPTRFSYFKGSSMESFILKPTSKIDFGCSTATAHLKELQRKYHVSEQLWNSIPNSCSS